MAVTIDPQRWATGTVVELYPWTEKLFSIRVEAEVAPFTAGQFTKLGLVIDDELVSRPYSYVNAPDERPLEFYFVTVPGGPLTSSLIRLRPGDPILVMKRPSGFLTLNEVPDGRYLWLLSTGTAIGPFLSMLKTDEPWRRFEKVVLVHAVRFARELSFREQIRDLQNRHGERFCYIPVVSREDTDFALRTRIPAAIGDGRLERRAGIPLNHENSQVMICGNPAMVRDTTETLKARGLTRNRRREPGQITVENYW